MRTMTFFFAKGYFSGLFETATSKFFQMDERRALIVSTISLTDYFAT